MVKITIIDALLAVVIGKIVMLFKGDVIIEVNIVGNL
jgi:hypothetical protein